MRALVEIDENDVEGLDCPFTLLYLFQEKDIKKAKFHLMKIHELSKLMGEQHRALDKIKKDEDESTNN